MSYPIETIIKSPSKWGNKVSVKTLANFIGYAMEIYHNEPEPIVEDKIYDILWDILVERDPNNPVLKNIGAPVRDDIVKVPLPYWMGSMDKVKPNSKELERWLAKYKGPFHISEKLDGLSGLITYNHGNNPERAKLYTRGNGKVGQDISHLIPHLKIPKITDTVLAIRGEFIIQKSIFQRKYASKYPKARSLVAGIINAKKPDSKILADVEFVAYEVVHPEGLKTSKQFEKLGKLGFNNANNKSFPKALNTEVLKQLLLDMKANSNYNIDGIIVADDQKYPSNKSGNPKHSVAFKMQLEDQTATTTIESVIWNPSKHGKLAPKVQFKSIVIGGDTITNATAFNAKYVKDNKLGKGAVIKIIRSGDVIPYILEVIKSAEQADFPENLNYHWNKSKIEIILDDLDESVEVRTRRLIHFFKTLKVSYLSEGLIKRLVENEFSTISAICQMSEDDFLTLPGFKDKMANKIHQSIHSVIDKPMPLHTLMTASNVFGIGFGERKLLPLVTKYPNIMKDWKMFNKGHIIDVEGFSTISAEAFLENLPKFVEFLEEHQFLKYEVPKKNSLLTVSASSKLKDASIVMTGFRDADLEEKIISLGGTVSSGVSSKTSVVIAKDPSSNSGKVKKAKELGVEVVSVEGFKDKYL